MECLMTEPAYDLIIRGGRVATTTDVFEADVAISGETIAAIGRGLPPAKREIDARGKLVLPGRGGRRGRPGRPRPPRRPPRHSPYRAIVRCRHHERRHL